MPTASTDKSLPMLHNGTQENLLALENGGYLARIVTDDAWRTLPAPFIDEWDGQLVQLESVPVAEDELIFGDLTLSVVDVSTESLRLEGNTTTPTNVLRVIVTLAETPEEE